jgi:hypothetical protein
MQSSCRAEGSGGGEVQSPPVAALQFIINLPSFYNKWRPAPQGFAVELMERAARELGRDHILRFELGNEPRYCEHQQCWGAALSRTCACSTQLQLWGSHALAAACPLLLVGGAWRR